MWPHRWEHDKGPDELLRLARERSREHSQELNLRWTILGERFKRVPPALVEFQREFGTRIDHCGFEPDRDAYWRRLASCDCVLSTATHEFFGIAVVEALLAGCLPWLPNRLSYPELLPPDAVGLAPHQLATMSDPEADALRSRIVAHLQPAVACNAVARLDEAIERAAHPPQGLGCNVL